MESYQVKFTCTPDPKNPEGLLLKYEQQEDITHTPNPFTATFRSAADLDSAFIAAGIYLHSFGQPDPTRNIRPDPDKNYLVTDDTLRTIGFDIPR
jgi:hypothetical protein